jgi:hypothetical protein
MKMKSRYEIHYSFYKLKEELGRSRKEGREKRVEERRREEKREENRRALQCTAGE